jgi:hypothetical protein
MYLGQAPNFWSDVHQRLDAQIVTPAEQVTQGALLGALGGGAIAAILGLTGEIIRPGNRGAVLSLIAIPVAATAVGVLVARQQVRRS